MKIRVFTSFILIFAFTMFWQDGNARNLQEPVIIQGLQLDWSKAEVQKKLDFSKAENLDSTGHLYKFYSPAENVDSMYLTFYKDRLKSISINYSNAVTPQLPLSQLRKKAEEDFGLPGNWKINQEKTGESATQTYAGLIITIAGSGEKYSAHFSSTAVIEREAADILAAEKEMPKKTSKP